MNENKLTIRKNAWALQKHLNNGNKLELAVCLALYEYGWFYKSNQIRVVDKKEYYVIIRK